MVLVKFSFLICLGLSTSFSWKTVLFCSIDCRTSSKINLFQLTLMCRQRTIILGAWCIGV